MAQDHISYLKDQAKAIRKTALTMIYKAQSGHPGGSFSAADILAALYFHFLKLDPQQPKWPDRDRFVLSKGHVCPALYSALILKGFLPKDSVSTLRRQGSLLQGHPDMKRCPGIDISTGSLGQGFSCAVGMALAAKRDNKKYMTYTLLGDGECNEGQIWEAAQTANKYQLDNLIVFVDHNRLQNDGFTEDIMPSADIAEKFHAFGFQTVNINGHHMEEIVSAVSFMLSQKNGKPKCIVCDTVKGKGVSFMENVAVWHGIAPDDEQYRQAIRELEGGLL
ncbi:transketolase [Massiliimalia timonensis]|uniref:transketolase n=1 Tax=Massiliimalia timonensis TaxID=1987501 RepID=UPI00189F4A0B|nr:transketolase [Massiliimalia timonensis]